MQKTLKKTYNQIRNILKSKIQTGFPFLYKRCSLFNDAKRYYQNRTGKELSYEKVSDINEKLFWLHKYWQNPLIVKCADKYRMREYVKDYGLENILVPLLGAYDNANDINFNDFPDKFVLKCNHGCGYNIICTNKEQFNIEEAKEQLIYWMNEIYGYDSFELHYSQIKPKIICEEYLDFSKPSNAIDYKIHCINGKASSILVCFNRNYTEHTVELASYSLEWKKLGYLKNESAMTVAKPQHLELMIKYATKLAQPFPYVRVDMYYIDNNIYVGELTFTPAGNVMDYYNDSALQLMGDELVLPPKYKSQWTF